MKPIERTCVVLLVVVMFAVSACSPNNVTIDNDIKTFFASNKVEGCFAIYDNAQNEFTIYNLSRFRDSAYLPASTFKIVNSMIALKTGKVFDQREVIKWDGITRSNPQWNQDLTLEQAFRYSSASHFQQVARRIGKDTMQLWLDSLHYGNAKISRIDSFWLDNTLKIKPDEQLGLVKKLYFDQLLGEKRPQDIVKQMMLFEDNTNYKLSYKTGWGFKENGNAIGWIVGWIEENKRPYFFVLNVEGDHDADMMTIRMNILKGILSKYGFFKGNK
jgi:beta-lactamase class D